MYMSRVWALVGVRTGRSAAFTSKLLIDLVLLAQAVPP
jgi:hypothetical protein